MGVQLHGSDLDYVVPQAQTSKRSSKTYETSANIPSFNGTKSVTIDLVNIEGCWFMLSAARERGFNSTEWRLVDHGNPVASSVAGTSEFVAACRDWSWLLS